MRTVSQIPKTVPPVRVKPIRVKRVKTVCHIPAIQSHHPGIYEAGSNLRLSCPNQMVMMMVLMMILSILMVLIIITIITLVTGQVKKGAARLLS